MKKFLWNKLTRYQCNHFINRSKC